MQRTSHIIACTILERTFAIKLNNAYRRFQKTPEVRILEISTDNDYYIIPKLTKRTCVIKVGGVVDWDLDALEASCKQSVEELKKSIPVKESIKPSSVKRKRAVYE